MLQLSILWDLSHTERAAVTQDPIFWAPHSWKDLRDLFIKVWYSVVPNVSIQCLAPERNLWCQIKHRSFLGSAGVSRWISRCLACQGQDACAAQQEMMRRGMHQRASSLRRPLLGGLWDGLRNPSPSFWIETRGSLLVMSRTWQSTIEVSWWFKIAYLGYLQ